MYDGQLVKERAVVGSYDTTETWLWLGGQKNLSVSKNRNGAGRRGLVK